MVIDLSINKLSRWYLSLSIDLQTKCTGVSLISLMDRRLGGDIFVHHGGRRPLIHRLSHNTFHGREFRLSHSVHLHIQSMPILQGSEQCTNNHVMTLMFSSQAVENVIMIGVKYPINMNPDIPLDYTCSCEPSNITMVDRETVNWTSLSIKDCVKVSSTDNQLASSSVPISLLLIKFT